MPVAQTLCGVMCQLDCRAYLTEVRSVILDGQGQADLWHSPCANVRLLSSFDTAIMNLGGFVVFFVHQCR